MPLCSPAAIRLERHAFRLLLAAIVLAEITTAQDQLVVLREFRFATEARTPDGPLLQASDGRLYGVGGGGAYGDGTVYSLSAGGAQAKTLFDFDGLEHGSAPFGSLLEASDGRLYGTTRTGGGIASDGSLLEVGTIYSVKRNGDDPRVLHLFDRALSGSNPRDGVIELPNGRLYGTTGVGGTLPGGAEGGGTLYSIKRDGADFQVLHVFDPESDGERVFARLTRGADGRLYGGATEGGANGHGTVFAIAPDGSDFVVLHHFQTSEGGPRGTLLAGSDQNLYGVTRHRTVNVPPSLFRISPNTGALTWLLQFPVPREVGISPLVEGSDGRLYGTAVRESLFAFRFAVNKDGSGFVNLGEIGPDIGPLNQLVPLIQTSAGRLFGVYDGAPEESAGAVYSFRTNGSDFRVTHEFELSAPEGYRPNGLNAGTDGRLYGVADAGGEFGHGLIYSIKFNGSGFKVLHSVDPDPDGIDLSPTLLRGGGGKWFGTTNLEGPGGGGVLFSLHPGRRRFTVLHAFPERLGLQNDMVLVRGSDGRLYGYLLEETEVFAVRTNGTGYTTLVDNLGDAGVGVTAIVELAPGLLVGVMREGGVYEGGIVFSVRTDGSQFQIEQDLGGSPDEPSGPGSLLLASNGWLYGSSLNGLFVIDPDTLQASRFAISGDPNIGFGGGSRIFEASDGRFYAGNGAGGANGAGTLYSFDGDGKTAAVHVAFEPGLDKPRRPLGPMAEGRDGRLYAASEGGEFRAGVLYALHRALRIVAQPEDVSVPAGQPAELRVGASGPGPLEFRWFHDGKRIRDARSAVLTFSTATASDAGEYHVEVRARGKKVVSATAVLDVVEL